MLDLTKLKPQSDNLAAHLAAKNSQANPSTISPDPTPKNKKLSTHFGTRINAVPKECWKNAAIVAMTHSFESPALYVEGFIVSFGLVIEHGWVEVAGEITDPTLPTDDLPYFAALKYTPEFLEAEMKRDGLLLLPLNLNWKNPTYCQVYRTAQEFVSPQFAQMLQ